MLTALSVRDFVIVDRLRLELPAGFGVLTGETGAGKSILIDALMVALGGRADAAMVRNGCERAEVTAEFDIAGIDALGCYLADQDLAGDGGECILRRVIDAGGRSRAYLNGRACTAGQLREAGEFLVEIHGQHEHQSLMRPAGQRAIVDAQAGATALAADVACLFGTWRAAAEARAQAESGAQAALDEQERLAWQVRELEQLGFDRAQWADLQADHGRLAHAAALIEGTEASLGQLSEGDGSAVSIAGAVIARLRSLVGHDARIGPVLEMVESARIQLQEAVYSLRHYRQGLDEDPVRLREIEARIDAVVSMSRKYRVPPEGLPGCQATSRERLDSLAATFDPQTLAAAEASARAAWSDAAATLSAARAETARDLAVRVTAAMQTLAMQGGTFDIALTPLAQPAATGLEQVEFLVCGHAGGNPRPVAKVASGGELSRLSLALQTATALEAGAPTLIFDEVDAGIGGGVAEVVGRMLAALGGERQVLCITHLPQVAALAGHQWRVSKRDASVSAASTVTPLGADERVEEIARMLGGVTITETTRRHAAEMLDGALGRP